MKKICLIILYGFIIRYFLKIFVGVHYINKQVLEEHEQFILIANHNSHVDTMAILAAMPIKKIHKIHPVAAGDYFGSSGLKAFCTRFFVNALLIPRARPKDGADTPNPIQLMIDILDKGESIIIFPEGSRGDPDVMQKFKKGIGCVLQQRPHIPYIPTYMKGMGKVLPKGEMLLVPFNTFVTFGKAQFTQTTVIEDIVAEVEVHIKSLQQPT